MRSFRPILPLLLVLLWIPLARAQLTALRGDNGVPSVAFRYPDLYGDDLRNMRFRAPAKCMLMGVLLGIPTRNFEQWTTGDPSLVVKVWPMGPDLLPVAGGEWISDTTVFDSFRTAVHPLDSAWTVEEFLYVDLARYQLRIPDPLWFHIGYTAVRNSADDSLAILSDNGSPAVPYASEWYDGQFLPMRVAWGPVGLFIRAVVLFDSVDLGVLAPGGRPADFSLLGAYPNPFNSSTRIAFTLARPSDLKLSVFDLLGRERAVLLTGGFAAGRHETLLNAAGWASGTYFIKLSSGDGVQTVPLVLEK